MNALITTILANVRTDLHVAAVADRKCHQLGTAPSFNRPANWRPFVAATMSDDLFAAPAGW